MTEKHTQGRLQQGRLLDTQITRRWTQAEREQTERHERRMLFVGFTPLDEGRSRMLVAVCERIEDARRLVACWNACEGAPTEWLEQNKPVKELADAIREAQAQRDELLAALEKLLPAYRRRAGLIDPNQQDAYTVDAHNFIAKAKGGAA